MIKLIATDMDGTLLNSAHEVSEENIKAIQYAQSKGVTVVIATGRAFYEANTPIKPTGLKVPFICLNGAEVRDEEFNIMHTSKLSDQQIKDVTSILDKYDLYYQVYSSARIYTEDKKKDLQIYLDIAEKMGHTPDVEKIRNSIQKRIDNGSLKEVSSYQEVYDRDGEIVMKFLAFSSDLEKLDAAKAELRTFKHLAVSASSRGNIEITHNDAQKGIALEAICEKLQIDMNQVMAIGDNLNDISMIEKAKYSYAMENGTEEVKAAANYMAGSNEESGVGRAIMQVMNEEV
ncbi:Cof-type HAD-IIB family hydrolase [Macrococcus animalis]|uniref:Cof-type HAD-IIB family hydrolase n=1 Tax=Macrococcus animalis TaxID=3395467 RepID=UPI0039BFB8D7